MSETTNILFIGNSFSEDVSYHMHEMAASAGVDIRVVNLYIPGCSLKQHWENAIFDRTAYRYELNGQFDFATADLPENLVKLSDTLKEGVWDHIITQQASHDSGQLATYEPFLSDLLTHVQIHSPASKLWLQETWSYELDSDHDKFYLYDHSQVLMYSQLNYAYRTVSEALGLNLIPTGSVLQELRQEPAYDYSIRGASLCRDGYHLTYLAGRYAASLVVLGTLLGIKPDQVTYDPVSRFVPEGGLPVEEKAVINQVVSDYFA